MKIEDFLDRLPNARKQGKEWSARCPAHEDRRASLSLSEGSDGRILITCFAGCSNEAIVSTLGLTLADLFPPKDALASPAVEKRNGKSQKKIAATYDYRAEDGNLLFQAVRYEPKSFSQRKPNGNGWVSNLNGVRRVLYSLPELLAADPGATVFVCEGEKDVERLRELDLIATTNPMGAGKWLDDYAECLRGREVVILPDNDDPGRAHASQVASSLYRVAASVKVLALPELPEKGDVSDWLDAGGDAERLCVLAEDAPEWTPENEANAEQTSSVSADEPPPLLFNWGELDDLDLPIGEPIIHELERGELALLAAVTNVGKSSFLRNLAICLATGREFLPVLKGNMVRRVLLLDFETRLVRLQRDIRRMAASLNQTEQKRLRENLAVICDATADDDEPLCLSNERHLNWVRMLAGAFKTDLIIVDTVAAGFSIREENSNAEVSSRILRPLVKLARDVKAAVIIAHHIGKTGSEDGKTAEKAYRARGASSFGAWAALVLNLTQDASDQDRVTLSLAKVKGERFDDVNLRLNREARWFESAGAPITEPPTSYRLMLNLFEDGREMKTSAVIAALAGNVAERTIKVCLARAVANGDLDCLKRGVYSKVQKVQTSIGTAQPALSADVPLNDDEDET